MDNLNAKYVDFVSPSLGYNIATGERPHICMNIATFTIGTVGIPKPNVGDIIGRSSIYPNENIVVPFIASGTRPESIVGCGSITVKTNGDIIISEIFVNDTRIGFYVEMTFLF